MKDKMARSLLPLQKRHALVVLLLLSALLLSAASMVSAQRRRRKPAPQGQQTTQANQSAAVPSQKKNITQLRGSDAPDGSRVMITSDVPLNDYSAYRSGDRYYVVIPEANAPRAESMRGRGFEDVQVQKRGGDAVLSFRLQPGTSAHVKQKFNRLEVVFNTPGAGANAGAQSQPPNTSPTPTVRITQDGKTTGAQTPNVNANTANANTVKPADSEVVKNQQGLPNASTVVPPGVAPTGSESELPPVSTVLPSPAQSPVQSPAQTQTPEQIAQAQSAPSVPSAVTTTAQPSSGTAFAAAVARNWPLAIIIGLVLLTIVGFIIARARSGRTTRPDVPDAGFPEKKLKESRIEETERVTPLAATPVAEQVLTPALVAPTVTLEEAAVVEELPEQQEAVAEEIETAHAEDAPAADFEGANVEINKLLAGEPYDESVVSAVDTGTRQLVAAGLLAALAGRNQEKRERAREAFIKHGYFDEATFDLRTADAPAERASAARHLGLIGDRAATPHLVAALEDSTLEVRRAAVEALAEVRDPAAVEPLQALLERERNRKKVKRVDRSLIQRAIEASTPAEEETALPAPVEVEAAQAVAGEQATEEAPAALEAGEVETVEAVEAVEAVETAPSGDESLEASQEETVEAPLTETTQAVGVEQLEPALTEAETQEVSEPQVAETPAATEEDASAGSYLGPAALGLAAASLLIPSEAVAEETDEDAQRDEEETARRRFEEEERLRVEEETRQREEAERARQEIAAQAARQRAEEEEQRAAEEARLRAEEEERQRIEAEAERQRLEAEAEAQRQAEEQAARERAEAEALRLAEEERQRVEAEAASQPITEVIERGEYVADEAASPATVESRQPVSPEWFEVDINAEPESLDQPSAESGVTPVVLDEAALITEMATEAAEPASAPFTQTSKELEAATSETVAASPNSFAIVEAEPPETERIVGIAERDEDFSTVPNNILRRLGSEEPEQRAAAVEDLARLGSGDAFREISAAFDDPEQTVRDAAARSLFHLDKDRAASFTRALREAPPERRRNIGAALASSGLAAEAIGNLMGESREKTYDAFSLLFLMSKAGEVRPLIRAIEEHPNNEVRLAVVKLLALSGQQEILPAFRRLAVRGSLPMEVRSAVMEAIYQLSSQAASDTPVA
jgi:HEAT repeat protein